MGCSQGSSPVLSDNRLFTSCFWRVPADKLLHIPYLFYNKGTAITSTIALLYSALITNNEKKANNRSRNKRSFQETSHPSGPYTWAYGSVVGGKGPSEASQRLQELLRPAEKESTLLFQCFPLTCSLVCSVLPFFWWVFEIRCCRFFFFFLSLVANEGRQQRPDHSLMLSSYGDHYRTTGFCKLLYVQFNFIHLSHIFICYVVT